MIPRPPLARRVVQNPIREPEQLHGRRVSCSDIPVQEELTLRGVYGRTIDMTVTVRPRSECGCTGFRMKAAAGSQHYTSITPLSADGISFQSQGKTVINVEKYDIITEN